MRELQFRSAVVRVHTDHVESIFREDGSVSRFFPPVGKPDFDWAVRYTGYIDGCQMGLEHDVLHHVVAQRLGWPRSYVCWWDAHGQPDDPDTQGWRDLEEHLVIRLQRLINLGIDDDYGVLRAQFGRSLSAFARGALVLVRPWLGG